MWERIRALNKTRKDAVNVNVKKYSIQDIVVLLFIFFHFLSTAIGEFKAFVILHTKIM